jgi:hypothetical protein
MSTVASAIDHIGLSRLAREFGYRPSAVQKWRDESRLPRSELAGLTHYASTIEELSAGKYLAIDMLAETRAAWVRHTAKARAKRQIVSEKSMS